MSTSSTTLILVVIIYMRVSTEEQGKGYSLPEQREECVRRAQEIADEIRRTKGAPVELQTVEFQDQMSGEILDRPALEAAVRFVKEHRPNYFICLDPDRLARKLVHQLLVTEDIAKAGTELTFVQHDYKNNPEGQLFYAVRGALAEYEKAKIKERTTRGARGKKKAGQLSHGACPYGYRFNTQTDQLEINEDEAGWVQQIFRWYTVEQLNPAAIVDRLNSMRVPTKKGTRWYSSTINMMLAKTTYTGVMYTNRHDAAGMTVLRQIPKDRRTQPITYKERPADEWIPVPVPAIIDSETFDVAQSRRRTNKRQSQRGAGVLSGLVKCGVCGGNVHYVADTRSGGFMLRCHDRYPPTRASKRPRMKCDSRAVTAALIERPFWEELKACILDPEELAKRRQRVQETQVDTGEIEQCQAEIQLLESQLGDHRRQQAVILGQQAKGLVEQEVADQLLGELKQSIDHIKRSIQVASARLESLTKTVESSAMFERQVESLQLAIARDRDHFEQILDNLDLARRQHVVRSLVSEVRIYPGRRYEWDPIS